MLAEISEDFLSQDSRGAARRTIRLVVSASAKHSGWSRATIQDLSETGLRIETSGGLTVGEAVLVELPLIGTVEARVVWKRQSTLGCEFVSPVSRAVVSAALLQGSVDTLDPGTESKVEELPVGTRPSVEEMMAWKTEFDQIKGLGGYQLLGFRQTDEGLIVALVTRTH